MPDLKSMTNKAMESIIGQLLLSGSVVGVPIVLIFYSKLALNQTYQKISLILIGMLAGLVIFLLLRLRPFINLHLYRGLYFDNKDNPHCPCCKKPLANHHDGGYGIAPKCYLQCLSSTCKNNKIAIQMKDGKLGTLENFLKEKNQSS